MGEAAEPEIRFCTSRCDSDSLILRSKAPLEETSLGLGLSFLQFYSCGQLRLLRSHHKPKPWRKALSFLGKPKACTNTYRKQLAASSSSVAREQLSLLALTFYEGQVGQLAAQRRSASENPRIREFWGRKSQLFLRLTVAAASHRSSQRGSQTS